MSITFKYGAGVAVLPASVIRKIDRASKKDIKILLSLAAMPETMQKAETDPSAVAKACSCTETELATAIAFWRGAGIIEGDEENTEAAEPIACEEPAAEPVQAVSKPRLQRADELPKYTTDELAVLLESRKDAAQLINECQNIMGKVFNVREINVLIGLCDYLTLDTEYIMILLTYCMSIGKKNLHFAEKLAFSLYDAGITTAEELSEELRRRELAQSAEGRIRALFGVGSRAFTTKEKKMISAWIGDMGYPIEIIERAYEATADATGKGSIPYANSILERWYSEGLKTLEDIEASHKKKAEQKDTGNSSFDMDDFFAAALNKSYKTAAEDDSIRQRAEQLRKRVGQG
jgi:DnaD/phage-associated family protein